MRKIRMTGVVSALTLSTALAVSPVAAQTPEEAETVNLDITDQPMNSALKELANQFDIQIVAFSEDVSGKSVKPIQGVYTSEEALDYLLTDSGLQYRQVDVRTIAVGSPDRLPVDYPGKSRPASNPVLMAQNQTSAAQSQSSQSSEVNRNDNETPSEIEEILVTGTHIRGIAPDSTPTISFDHQDIRATGLPTLAEFLKTIPQNFGGGNQEENRGPGTNGGGDRGGAGVNLRGFGNGRTLSLLNGRRISAEQGARGPSVDVSIIPIAALERVEIITAGASSIYGSDAVGGVVNFILRDDFEGAETTASGGTLTDGDGTTLNASQLFGGSWDSGNAMIVYDYFTQDSLLAGDRDFTDPAIATNELTPNLDRHVVYAALRQGIGNSGELFGNVYYSDSDFSRDVNLNFQSLFLNEAADRTSYGGTVGYRYDISDSWQAEGYVTHSRAESTFEQTNLSTGLLASARTTRESTSTIIGAKADGRLFAMPGGDVKLAIGGETRSEKDANVTTTLDNTLEADVASAFGELYVPLVGLNNALPGVKRLELTVSARHENFEGNLDSTDPQVGLVWAPTEDLKFRGNWGTSFRTPTLAQQNPTPVRASVFGFFTIPNPVSATPATLFLQGTDPDLHEETSEFWTVGFDYSPERIPGLALSVTYFNIDLEDEIGVPPFSINLGDPLVAEFVTLQPTQTQILDALAVFSGTTPMELDAALAAQGLVFDDIEAIYIRSRRNIAHRVTKGFDAMIDYRFDTKIGRFGVNLNSSYIRDYDIIPFAAAPSVSILDTLNQPVGLRLNAGLSWSRAGTSANVFIRYVDSYKNELETPAFKIDSFLTVGLNASYSFGESGSGALSGVGISLAIQNLFDEDPPLVGDNDGSNSFPGSGTGYDPVNASALGRSINLTLSKRW